MPQEPQKALPGSILEWQFGHSSFAIPGDGVGKTSYEEAVSEYSVLT